MRNRLRSLTVILIAVLAPLVFSGCFSILHDLNLNKDGTVSVRWRFALSSAFGEMSKMQGGGEQASPVDDLAGADKELQDKYKGVADNVVAKKFEDEHNMGVDVTLTVKKLDKLTAAALPKDELPILPVFDAGKKELVFRFPSSATKKLQADQSGTPAAGEGSTEMNGGDTEAPAMAEGDSTSESTETPAADPGMDQMTQQMTKLFSSSATYDFVLGAGLAPKEAYILKTSDGTKKNLEILQLGEQTMIRFPFLSVLSDKTMEKGFDIVIKLK